MIGNPHTLSHFILKQTYEVGKIIMPNEGKEMESETGFEAGSQPVLVSGRDRMQSPVCLVFKSGSLSTQ